MFLSPEGAALVFSDAPDGARLLAHELTHVRQYRRAGAAVFLGSYVGEYLGRRLAGARHAQAYCELSFEREAEKARLALEDISDVDDCSTGSGQDEAPWRRSRSSKRGSPRIESKKG